MPAPQPFVSELTWRARNDDGSETSATWREPASVQFAVGPGETFRWRSQVGVTVIPISRDFTVQYSLNQSTWVTASNSSAVVQIAPTSQGFSDDTATTNQLGIPGGYGGGYVPGQLLSNDALTAVENVLTGQYVENEWTLKLVANSVPPGQIVYLRTYMGTFNAPLNGYVTPASFVALFPLLHNVPVAANLVAQYSQTVPLMCEPQ